MAQACSGKGAGSMIPPCAYLSSAEVPCLRYGLLTSFLMSCMYHISQILLITLLARGYGPSILCLHGSLLGFAHIFLLAYISLPLVFSPCALISLLWTRLLVLREIHGCLIGGLCWGPGFLLSGLCVTPFCLDLHHEWFTASPWTCWSL